jgi:putative transposase
LNLVEKHIIKETKELNILCFKCKNLYNRILYDIRQDYFKDNVKPNKYELYTKYQKLEEYKVLPRRISRGVIRMLVSNWDAYFVALNSWYRNKNLFKGQPRIPKYLDKKGKFTAIFTDTAVLIKNLKKKGLIGLSSLKIQIEYQHKNCNIVEVQVIPYKNKKYKINIVYKYDEQQIKENNSRYCSIDLGVNNLMTLTSNTGLNPIIVNGRPLKSINQYYNKQLAFYKSELDIKQKFVDKKLKFYKSKKIDKLTYKRENKINDYLHKSTKFLINYCLTNNLNTIIIGYNKLWKQDVSLSKKINQNFVSIPFYKLISMIEYKAKMYGLSVILNEESYTSKCSFLDLEDIKKQEIYKGKRIKRGLFKSNNGRFVNADVNASFNILKKVVSNAFKADDIEGVSVHPIKINF